MDGKNVWPFAGNIDPGGHPANDNLHYDIAALRIEKLWPA